MRLLQIITFYIGTNIISLPRSINHYVFSNTNKIKTEIITKTKTYE